MRTRSGSISPSIRTSPEQPMVASRSACRATPPLCSACCVAARRQEYSRGTWTCFSMSHEDQRKEGFMRAKEAMTRDVRLGTPGSSIRECAQIMAEIDAEMPAVREDDLPDGM